MFMATAKRIAQIAANQRSTCRGKSAGPPRASSGLTSLAVISRSVDSVRSASQPTQKAAPAVTAHATAIIGQSGIPTSTSLTATARLAIGTSTIAERSRTPGSIGASAGSIPSRNTGKK